MISKTRGIKDTKGLVRHLPAIRFLKPQYVYLATDNARCSNCELFIKPGDKVKAFQLIGMRHAAYFDQPIHSTVSGTFVGLEKHYHRSGKVVDFIKLENDFKDTPDDTVLKERSDEEIYKMTREEMTQIIKDAAMVGLGGSSFPTYVKFQVKDPINVLLINAIECEPYITADQRIIMEYPYRVIEGIKYLMHAFNVKRAIICIKKKYHDVDEILTQIAQKEEGIEVCKVGNFFPQGWEVAMIKSALGINIKPGELPSKYGIINFNVSTCVGIYKAIKWNMPVIKRSITVTGDGVKYPQNFRVLVGTSLKEILPLTGGYKNPDVPKMIIMGGPMMGASIPSDDCIITKTVTSIIVLDKVDYKEEPCVRCGSCVLSCPTGLEPVQIMNAVKALDKEKIKALNSLRCIECGLCTYSCTSKIKILDYIRKGKVMAKL